MVILYVKADSTPAHMKSTVSDLEKIKYIQHNAAAYFTSPESG